MVLRLGSIVLAAALLGVPRAVEARAFGAQRCVYVEVAPENLELQAFAAELERAIGASALTLAARRSDAAVVVELLGVSRSEAGGGLLMEAARFVLRDGTSTRPVILHYSPGQRAPAARRLLERLPTLEH